MKKSNKNSRVNELILDIVEYAFTKWLIREGIFTSFKTNYECTALPFGGFHDRLRAHIRRSLCSPDFDPSRLVSSAFLFSATPEGSSFWQKQSAAWERFYIRLKSRL